jgi:transposase
MNAVAQKLGVGTGETGESEELRRLKRENAELKRTIEILKPASAFFAAEIDRPRGRW